MTAPYPDLSLDDAAEALRHIPPCDRAEWINAGNALKSEFGDSAWPVWDDWSQGDSSYKARDAKDVWRSLRTGKVPIGWLIKRARECGWSPPRRELSPQEQAERQRAVEERRQEATQRAEREAAEEAEWHERIAALAQRVWEECTVEVGKAPYLGAKGVRGHGVRFIGHSAVVVVDSEAKTTDVITGRSGIASFYGSKPQDQDHISFRHLKAGVVVVPMRDARDDTLVNLQLIHEGGRKTFLKHGRKQGTCHVIRAADDAAAPRTLAVCEGYATAATVHEATGWGVVVAWDRTNLTVVAQAVHERWGGPDKRIVICGDDDHETEGNPGRKAADRAAADVGGKALYPVFRDPAGKTDWNDLQAEQGQKAVREQLLAAAGGASTPPPAPLGGGVDEPPEDWEQALKRTNNGGVQAWEYNVALILEHHPAWAGCYTMDAFSNTIYRTRPPPYGRDPGMVDEADGAELAMWVQKVYSAAVRPPTGSTVIETVSRRHAYHPVLDYLDGLTWDGTPRLGRMLSDLFGADYSPYTDAVGRCWLMSACARVRWPGCKVDTMTILEGPQGRGKSTAVRTLCGPAWFAEMTSSPGDKDFYQILSGRWMVEIPELQGFSKADRNKIKAAISAQEDTYRPSYGRYARQFPRQTIFVGTTNDDTYLKDETGARRFLPVKVGWIEFDALASVRDQLLAEADHLVRKGKPWWDIPEDEAREQQEARYDADAWEEPIREWVSGKGQDYPPDWTPVAGPIRYTTVADVMRWALRIETGKHTRPDQMRVGSILKRWGWQRERRLVGDSRIYVYARPGGGQ